MKPALVQMYDDSDASGLFVGVFVTYVCMFVCISVMYDYIVEIAGSRVMSNLPYESN